MKAKIYPLEHLDNKIEIGYSNIYFNTSIVLASLSNGTSIIEGIVDSLESDVIISSIKQLGASVKRNENKLFIKGIDNNITLNNSLFYVDDFVVPAYILIPTLSLSNQPFGIKGTPRALSKIILYKEVYEKLGIRMIYEYGIIRCENSLMHQDVILDGQVNPYVFIGLLIALSLCKGSSSILLKAPIREERIYPSIIKLVRKFGGEIKNISSFKCQINSISKYKKANVYTHIFIRNLAYSCLLLLKVDANMQKIKIKDYFVLNNKKDIEVFSYLKKNLISLKGKRKLKLVNINTQDLNLNFDNALSFNALIACLSTYEKVAIHGTHFISEYFNKQFNIIEKAYNKMGIKTVRKDDEIIIYPRPINNKFQIDCEGDPVVFISFAYLALLKESPITIKHAECIYSKDKYFFDNLKNIGAKIELIHD